MVAVRSAQGAVSSYDGVLRPRRDIALGFKTGGRVVALTVKVGDHVRAGQILARLATADAVATSSQAAAELAASAAEASQARDSANRAAGLDASGALAGADVRAREFAAAAAAAKREAARAALARTRTMLGDAVLTAPEAGIVTERTIETGTVVSPGAIVIRLAAGELEVEVKIPETIQLRPGAVADVAFVSASERPLKGRLRLIEPSADGALRLRTARFTLVGNATGIPYNSSATITLAGGDAGAKIRVPLAALSGRSGRGFVWTISHPSDKVHRQPVRIEELRGDDALITGLTEGQRIVASGGDTLTEGQQVVTATTERGGR